MDCVDFPYSVFSLTGDRFDVTSTFQYSSQRYLRLWVLEEFLFALVSLASIIHWLGIVLALSVLFSTRFNVTFAYGNWRVFLVQYLCVCMQNYIYFTSNGCFVSAILLIYLPIHCPSWFFSSVCILICLVVCRFLCCVSRFKS